MPTGESPFRRACRIRVTATRRPSVCGREASAIVQPSSPDGHSTIPVGPSSAGEGSVLVVGSVAKPPVAVRTSADSRPPDVAATATAAPPRATRRAAIARSRQPTAPARGRPSGPGPGSRTPHSRQYSC